MKKINLFRIFQIVLILFGIYSTRGLDSSPALTWMDIYWLEDFKNYSWKDILVFIQQNKLPLPPVIIFAELTSLKLFSSTYVITSLLYKIALILPYLLIMSFAKTSPHRMTCVFLVSCLFMYCSINIHRGNPQGYDVFLPFFIILFIKFIHGSISCNSIQTKKILAFGAGLCLSMAELSRPFMIYLTPVLIITVLLRYLNLKVESRKLILYFLLPIIFLSGLLHLNLYVNHGQINFSNHAGFNLHRAWSRLVPMPTLVDEPTTQSLSPNRGENWNTEEHHINSKIIQTAIFKHWLTQPIASMSFGISLLSEFMTASIDIYGHRPNSIFLQTYRFLYQILSSLLLINFILLLILLLKHRERIKTITLPDNLLILIGASLICIFAISEKAEEARFVISTLPFVGALSLVRINDKASIATKINTNQHESGQITFRW